MEKDREVIVVTGASGTLGTAIIDALAQHFNIVGFDRPGSPHPPKVADCVPLDITSDESMRDALQNLRARYGRRIASVIHLAAYYDFSGAPDPQYDAINVQGTERLLRGLRDFSVEQFVYSGTMLVYAPTVPGIPITEDWPLDPKWIYPQSKLAAENVIRAWHGAIPTVLLRIAGIYTDQCHSPTLAHQIQRIHARTLISHVFPGNLAHGQAYIHLDDLVAAFVPLLQRRAYLPTELVLNLGESCTMSYEALQNEIGQLLFGSPWQTREVPKAIAKTGAWLEGVVPIEKPFIKPFMIDLADDHFELDITRARELLGWQPVHSLRETLPVMIDALKRDPAGWYRDNHLDTAAIEHKEARPPDAAAKSAMGNGHAGHADTAKQDQQEKLKAGNPAGGMTGHSSMGTLMGGGHETMAMYKDHTAIMRQHMQMMDQMRQMTLWAHFANAMLGVWLITSPFLFGYLDTNPADPLLAHVTQLRHLPPIPARALAMALSDVISGILVTAFGFMALSKRLVWAQWANTFVGLWLLFAPLVFWSPSSAAYVNDTLVGALVIAFSVLIPMMPGMNMEGMAFGPDIPPGWDYCPSTWLQRLPIIALALVGFFIARYLGAYQLGYISHAWDPFFQGGHGTETIITSSVSRAWPVPDAGLGAVAYMLEALMGMMGDKKRWHTMPWMVLMFGILVVPLGAVSIFFIIIQPIVIGTWCTLCLAAALAMLIMIPFSLDELVAMGQFLLERRRAGKPFWRTFLQGDVMEGGSEDRAPGFDAPLKAQAIAMARGVNVPWTLLASTVIGVGLMFTRVLFDTRVPAANSDHLMGSLIITVSVIAMAEVARPLRFVNVMLGGWLIIAPWLLSGQTGIAMWTDMLLGVAVILLSFSQGAVRNRYAGWNRLII